MSLLERAARCYALALFFVRVKLLKWRLDAAEREASKRADGAEQSSEIEEDGP